MDSTLGEGEATIEGVVQAALTFLPPILSDTGTPETLLIVTDSHALFDVFQHYVKQTPTISEELKTPMGGTAATLRNILEYAQEKLKLKVIMEWQSNYHDEPFDSDNFLDFKKQFNNIVDIGATLGRDVIFQDPPPATQIKSDFGSSADSRATPARPGHGHPLVVSMQHLNSSEITKEDVANIQSARNLNYLAAANSTVGTTARHVLAGRVDPVLTNSLRATVPPRPVSAAARYSCGRWKSSNSEFDRHLSCSTTTDIFPTVMNLCRGKGALCLWCPTDKKDSLFHARFDTNPPCREPNTLAINALCLATHNEALMRTGRSVPPQRPSFPPPRWSYSEQRPINETAHRRTPTKCKPTMCL